MTKYELSIAENYVPGWTVVDAVRELFQNALDQEAVDESQVMSFDLQESAITITNQNAKLKASSLLLGASTKLDNVTTIGQFGEGYKLALLVLLRLGKRVVIENYGSSERWIPTLKYVPKYGTKILTVSVSKVKKVQHTNLTFAVAGLTEKDIEAIVESNLHFQIDHTETVDTPKGIILLDDRHKGKVYVSGLHICDHKYMYGYNFKPQYLKLDRDRKLVSDFDLEWLASEMWAASGSDKIIELAEAGAKDVQYIANQYMYAAPAKNVPDQALAQFKLKHGERAHPVTNQTEMAELQTKSPDAKAVIVTPGLQHLIKSSQEYVEPEAVEEEEVTLAGRLASWLDKVEGKLTKAEIAECSQIIWELNNA